SLRPRMNRSTPVHDTSGELLEETVEELRVAVEELRVAEEEITTAALGAEAQRLVHDREAERFRDVFDTSPSAALLTDAAGAIVRANRRAGELLGVNAPDLAGKPVAVFVAEDERRAFR